MPPEKWSICGIYHRPGIWGQRTAILDRMADACVGFVGSRMRLPFHVGPSRGWFAKPQVSAWLAVPLALIIAFPIADHFLPPGDSLGWPLCVASAFTLIFHGV
jgi:hypothetical protein